MPPAHPSMRAPAHTHTRTHPHTHTRAHPSTHTRTDAPTHPHMRTRTHPHRPFPNSGAADDEDKDGWGTYLDPPQHAPGGIADDAWVLHERQYPPPPEAGDEAEEGCSGEAVAGADAEGGAGEGEVEMEVEEGVEETGRLFVRNLCYGATEDELSELFSPMGELAEVHLVVDRWVEGLARILPSYSLHPKSLTLNPNPQTRTPALAPTCSLTPSPKP